MRALWPIIPLTALNYAPTTGIRGLWAGPYLADVYGADSLVIGQVTFFMALAMVAGAFIYGPLDTIFKTRKWVAVGGNSLSVLALPIWRSTPSPGLTGVDDALRHHRPVRRQLRPADGACPRLRAGASDRARRDADEFLLDRRSWRDAVRHRRRGDRVSVPGDPAPAYAALFLFYVLLLGLAVLIYLFARDAKPQRSPRA